MNRRTLVFGSLAGLAASALAIPAFACEEHPRHHDIDRKPKDRDHRPDRKPCRYPREAYPASPPVTEIDCPPYFAVREVNTDLWTVFRGDPSSSANGTFITYFLASDPLKVRQYLESLP